MKTLTSPKLLKELLARHGFQFSRSLGQNFLIDENILQKIIKGAAIFPEDRVLEIGPGVGTLTTALAKKAERVVAVEIDRSLLPILQETLEGFSNVEVIHGDILKLNLDDLIEDRFGRQPFKVVANLPYYITTPIIMRFLEEEHPYASITVMVQKEVAERLAAQPGSKEYGALSVAVQFYTRPQILCKVPASVFLPPPRVDSMVVTLEKRSKPAVDVASRSCFFQVVKAVFAQRRKTLLNTLTAAGMTSMDKTALSQMLIALNIDPKRRGETLTLKELADISNQIKPSRPQA
ncbi:MAG: 16S rRNA (adenine(1518)-N(6)/adenine(1519)-N(6))-dimethyltransferase RsmA [Caldicoprobacterales bacterium]|jgi:16S rRNA (adenine1518-N6/adenine1519-N6)-dimethyltransferase|nr:16S rRNA (adenine(1518)-N(6)/adenine(1519)-N(6))-dimethyltransferase RsmA [Clostridiales bacterium]